MKIMCQRTLFFFFLMNNDWDFIKQQRNNTTTQSREKNQKHKEKTSNNLDPKLARPYSKDPSDLIKSAIMSGSLPKRNWKAKPIHKSCIWCSIKLSFSWIKLLRKRGKIHLTTPTPMSSTQQTILVLVVHATNLRVKRTHFGKDWHGFHWCILLQN